MLRHVLKPSLFNGIQTSRINVLSNARFSTDLGKDKSDLPVEKKVTNKLPVEAPQVKEWKPSFIKQLFVGNFDHEILTYPEVLKFEEYETLEQMHGTVEKYFVDNVDSKKIDREAKIPEEVLNGLKELGLFGQQIPTNLGGLGLNATGYARVAEAVSDGSIAVTLAAHQAIGLKGLILYGSNEQKKKYLPELASGQTLAAFCLTEPGAGSDAASVKTSARLSSDGKYWILNGSKVWISNGGIANFFTVFASTDDDVSNKSHKRITAFGVERSFGGITNGKPEDKLGIRGSNTCEVHFENTHVPVENVLGGVGNGFKVAVNILNSGRFSMGASGAAMLRRLIKLISEHAVQRKQFGRPLSDFGLIKEKVARMTINAYIMESMTYLTAGLLDSENYEDCAVEAAIVKIFSSEAAWSGASDGLQILGGLGYMREYPYEQMVRDSRILLIFEGTNEILRLFVALMGVQTAGKELQALVKQLRNPFQFPGLIFRKTFQRWNETRKAPKLTLDLGHYVHPTLKDCAQRLEYGVHKLKFIIELLLQRHGAKITEAQLELQRVANIAIDLYTMTAVVARASRSYCTGIRNGGDEVMIAEIVTKDAVARITKNIQELEHGNLETTDCQIERLADNVFQSKGYHLEHPLVRNIW